MPDQCSWRRLKPRPRPRLDRHDFLDASDLQFYKESIRYLPRRRPLHVPLCQGSETVSRGLLRPLARRRHEFLIGSGSSKAVDWPPTRPWGDECPSGVHPCWAFWPPPRTVQLKCESNYLTVCRSRF